MPKKRRSSVPPGAPSAAAVRRAVRAHARSLVTRRQARRARAGAPDPVRVRLAREARRLKTTRALQRRIEREAQRQRDGAIDLARVLLHGSDYEVIHRPMWERVMDELQALRGRRELHERLEGGTPNGENESLRRDVPQGETLDV